MRAVLLAAGLGSRLRPLTRTVPKCLVRIDDRPLLDIWLDALAKAGVGEVLVNTHHLAPVVEAHLARRAAPPCVRTAYEPTLLGSAGTLVAHRQFLAGDGDAFLAVNADNLTDFDPRRLLDAHRAAGRPATIAVFRAARPSQCGVVEVDGEHRVVGFEEKPAAPRGDLANAGMYVFDPAVLDDVPRGLPRDIGFDLLPRLVGRATAVPIGGSYFRDVGTLEALQTARREWGEVAQR